MSETANTIPLPNPLPASLAMYIRLGYHYDGRHLHYTRKDGITNIILWAVPNAAKLRGASLN